MTVNIGGHVVDLNSYTACGDGKYRGFTPAGNNPVSGNLSIMGSPLVGSTLIAITQGIEDVDGLGPFSYQWKQDGVPLIGETNATYLVASGDIGTRISCTVSFTDGFGNAEAITETTRYISAGTGKAFEYVGVHYPTDALCPITGAVAPSGATNITHEWYGTYDPFLIATPTPTPGGAANEWYVDPINGDDANGQGHSAAPRKTIPSSALSGAAGTILFIKGNNTTSGYDVQVSTNSGQTPDSMNVTMAGTYTSQCWIVGIDNPRLGGSLYMDGATHTLVDGIKLVYNGISGSRTGAYYCNAASKYTIFRNGEISGDLLVTGGGASGFSFNDAAVFNQYNILYQTVIHTFGNWLDGLAAGTNDYHGGRVAWRCQYTWIINCVIFHVRGNGIQLGNSAFPTTDTSAYNSQYIYIAGCDIYSTQENCLASKASYDVIQSCNKLHNALGSKTNAGAVPLILTIDGEGMTSNRHWALNNEIYNFHAFAIRCAHVEQTNEISGAMNNYIHDGTASAFFLEGHPATGSERHFHNNTCANIKALFEDSSGGDNTDRSGAVQSGNILYNPSIPYLCDVVGVFRGANIIDTVGYDPDGAITLSSKNLTSTNSILNVDPGFTNLSGWDITIGVSSPAYQLTTRHSIYATYQSMYGLDIAKDFYGNAISGTGNINAGAAQ